MISILTHYLQLTVIVDLKSLLQNLLDYQIGGMEIERIIKFSHSGVGCCCYYRCSKKFDGYRQKGSLDYSDIGFTNHWFNALLLCRKEKVER